MRRGLLAAMALSGGLGLVGSPAAKACSCASSSDEGSLDASAVVFTAAIQGVEVLGDPLRPGTGAAIWTFHVHRVFKGATPPTVRIATAANGGVCGLELRAPDVVLVFADALQPPARQPHDEVRLVAHLCGGSRPLAQGPVPASFGAGVEPDAALEPFLGPRPAPAVPPPAAGPNEDPAAPGMAAWWLLGSVALGSAALGVAAGAVLGRRRPEKP